MTTTKKTTTKSRKSRTVTVKKPVSLDLPRNPFMFEILDLVSKQRTKAKKIEVLKKYEDLPLKVILIWNFDESVVSILPPGDVPYTGYDEHNIFVHKKQAKEKFAEIAANITMIDNVDASIEWLDKYCANKKPHIIVVDQLDKLNVMGSFARTDEKLREIYTKFREVCKRRDVFGIGAVSYTHLTLPTN